MSAKDRIDAYKARIAALRPVSVVHKKESVNRYSQMSRRLRDVRKNRG